VLDAEAQLGVFVERLLTRFDNIGGREGDRLVARAVFCPRKPHAAKPPAVLDVAAPEDDQSVLEFFGVDHEGHRGLPRDFCELPVYVNTASY
jgi:hypothetical protein